MKPSADGDLPGQSPGSAPANAVQALLLARLAAKEAEDIAHPERMLLGASRLSQRRLASVVGGGWPTDYFYDTWTSKHTGYLIVVLALLWVVIQKPGKGA